MSNMPPELAAMIAQQKAQPQQKNTPPKPSKPAKQDASMIILVGWLALCVFLWFVSPYIGGP